MATFTVDESGSNVRVSSTFATATDKHSAPKAANVTYVVDVPMRDVLVAACRTWNITTQRKQRDGKCAMEGTFNVSEIMRPGTATVPTVGNARAMLDALSSDDREVLMRELMSTYTGDDMTETDSE